MGITDESIGLDIKRGCLAFNKTASYHFPYFC